MTGWTSDLGNVLIKTVPNCRRTGSPSARGPMASLHFHRIVAYPVSGVSGVATKPWQKWDCIYYRLAHPCTAVLIISSSIMIHIVLLYASMYNARLHIFLNQHHFGFLMKVNLVSLCLK